MDVYVFLTNTLSGVSGGPIYVRNKMSFLKEKGWAVLAIDNTDMYDDPIIVDELKPYKNNRLYELVFPPSWFVEKKRKKIIKKMLELIIQTGDNRYVIESLQITLGLWGELLAKELRCKHIIYNINENDIINGDQLFAFLDKKYVQNELFCISPQSVVKLFSKYERKNDAEKHYWNASVQNNVDNIPLPILETVKETDFCIGYFGRYKRFVPYIVDQVKEFCGIQNKLSVVLIFLGITEKELNINSLPNNLRCICLGPISPIPLAFFNCTNVVIATAGCASISSKYSPLVISMSVEENSRVIGFLGKTTNSSSYPTPSDTVIKPLREYLELCYSGEAYKIPSNGYYVNQLLTRGYDYQLNCLDKVSNPIEVTGMDCAANKTQKLMKLIVGVGMSKVAYYIKKMHFKTVRKRL